MRKLALILPVLFLAAVTFSSCKKCMTCSYSYEGVVEESDEKCGNKEELEDFERLWMEYEHSKGVDVICE